MIVLRADGLRMEVAWPVIIVYPRYLVLCALYVSQTRAGRRMPCPRNVGLSGMHGPHEATKPNGDLGLGALIGREIWCEEATRGRLLLRDGAGRAGESSVIIIRSRLCSANPVPRVRSAT
jgi:hypothetical protein